MYTRLATLTMAGILIAGTAFAASDPNRPTRTAEECTQLVVLTQKTVEDQNDIGEKARTEVDKLLSQLQSHCNASQFDEADQTAALIRGLVATE